VGFFAPSRRISVSIGAGVGHLEDRRLGRGACLPPTTPADRSARGASLDRWVAGDEAPPVRGEISELVYRQLRFKLKVRFVEFEPKPPSA